MVDGSFITSGIDNVGHHGRHELIYFKYITVQLNTELGTGERMFVNDTI